MKTDGHRSYRREQRQRRGSIFLCVLCVLLRPTPVFGFHGYFHFDFLLLHGFQAAEFGSLLCHTLSSVKRRRLLTGINGINRANGEVRALILSYSVDSVAS